jgi:hypothetical protein
MNLEKHSLGWERILLVAQLGLEVDDDVFLLLREHSALQPGPQVVDPTQTTALAISLETFEKASPFNRRRKLVRNNNGRIWS